MTNKELIISFIGLSIVVLIPVSIFWFFASDGLGKNDIRDCSKGLSTYGEGTEEECIVKIAIGEEGRKIQHINEVKKSQEIGCEIIDQGYCKINGKTYYNYKESDDSKLCSPYKDSKISEVPVKCIKYWNEY